MELNAIILTGRSARCYSFLFCFFFLGMRGTTTSSSLDLSGGLVSRGAPVQLHQGVRALSHSEMFHHMII